MKRDTKTSIWGKSVAALWASASKMDTQVQVVEEEEMNECA
jgi:hypothetical protein